MCRQKLISPTSALKGHSHLVHMSIRYHFLADLQITLHPQVSRLEAHPLKNQTNLVESKCLPVKIIIVIIDLMSY